jgi:hypothetical protein
MGLATASAVEIVRRASRLEASARSPPAAVGRTTADAITADIRRAGSCGLREASGGGDGAAMSAEVVASSVDVDMTTWLFRR